MGDEEGTDYRDKRRDGAERSREKYRREEMKRTETEIAQSGGR